MMKTVVFDLDGTLADTSGDLIAAANACFRDMGAGDVLDPTKDAGTALRGGRAMLRLGMERMGKPSDDPLIDEYYDALLYHYARDIDTHTRLYDGAMDAVTELKARGFIVAICTNKPEALARTLLTQLGILEEFAAMLGADTLAVRKPDPEHLNETVRRAGGDPAQCVLVGDSDTDRNTSKAAGTASILVTFGPAGGDMAALAPEALLEQYSDLPDLVEQLLGKV
tara:strand:- start:526 stop:1200 length:675 start_codon:yes stop_codon:yes gene_type:complete